jgi:hypothetical protein
VEFRAPTNRNSRSRKSQRSSGYLAHLGDGEVDGNGDRIGGRSGHDGGGGDVVIYERDRSQSRLQRRAGAAWPQSARPCGRSCSPGETTWKQATWSSSSFSYSGWAAKVVFSLSSLPWLTLGEYLGFGDEVTAAAARGRGWGRRWEEWQGRRGTVLACSRSPVLEETDRGGARVSRRGGLPAWLERGWEA